MKRDSETLR